MTTLRQCVIYNRIYNTFEHEFTGTNNVVKNCVDLSPTGFSKLGICCRVSIQLLFQNNTGFDMTALRWHDLIMLKQTYLMR